jgi:DNA-directed RNA polymerase subunit RPC12/RpoP
MINGVIYRCSNCDEKFFFSKNKESIQKAPCPYCDTCTLNLYKDKRDQISSSKTAADLFDKISEYGGR